MDHNVKYKQQRPEYLQAAEYVHLYKEYSSKLIVTKAWSNTTCSVQSFYID